MFSWICNNLLLMSYLIMNKLQNQQCTATKSVVYSSRKQCTTVHYCKLLYAKACSLLNMTLIVNCYKSRRTQTNFKISLVLYTTIVHYCALLYTVVHYCTLLYTIHYCTLLDTTVHNCTVLYTTVTTEHYCALLTGHYCTMYATVHYCTVLYTTVSYSLLYTTVQYCTLLNTTVHFCTATVHYTTVHCCTLLYAIDFVKFVHY